MHSIPFGSATLIPEATLAAQRAIHETRCPSPWGTDHKPITPSLLPYTFGDGKQPVLISFFNAPEIVIIALFDSQLPIDHDDLKTRCQLKPTITSLREAMEEIYDLCENTWHEPPHLPDYRKTDLADEYAHEREDDEQPNYWSEIIRGGSKWCPA